MRPTRATLLALLVLLAGLLAGAPPVPGQEDRVTLTVTVETPDGDPIRDARLTATWDGGSAAPTSTRANGQALIDVPPDASVTIRLAHDDYVRNTPFVVSDASERSVTIVAYPRASARVVVEDADRPVADAEVTLRKGGEQVFRGTTTGEGVLDSGVVEAGVYSVSVFKPGYYRYQETVDIRDVTDVPITVERGTVTLEVNVTDDHFDPPRPIGDVTVDVEASGAVTTQPTGIGRISVPVNEWATLRLEKDGYEPTTESVYVREENVEVDLTMRRAPSISLELLSERVVVGERVSLSVTDEYGAPVAGATVHLDGEAVAETDDSGQAVVEIASAGEHTVIVESGSLSTGEHTVVGVDSDGDGDTVTTITTTAAGTGTETESELPGFGAVVALLALLAVAGLGVRRGRG